jgi:hypothetical protein
MMKSKTEKVLEWVKDSPFRAIEGIIAAPFFFMGLYSLGPWYTPGPGSPLWQLVSPLIIVKITGVLYLISGITLGLGAYCGGLRGRRLAMRIFLFTMLYGLLLRLTEEGFGLNSMIYLASLAVVASVDVIQLSGEDV